MTTPAGHVTAFLVVRAWKEPGGPLCTRIGAVTDPALDEVQWEHRVGVDQTLDVVTAWLQRWALGTPATADRDPVHPPSGGTHVHARP